MTTKDEALPLAWATKDLEEIMSEELRQEHLKCNSYTPREFPIPLYPRPQPAQKPLSAERAWEIWEDSVTRALQNPTAGNLALIYARAIEAELKASHDH